MSTNGSSSPNGAVSTNGAVAPVADAAVGVDENRILLDVRDLRTTFMTPRGPLPAVDGVSLTLRRGETLGVVGESGSGKTVLSRSIMGLLPGGRTTELTGSVNFDGMELVGASEAQLRSIWGPRIAMVFQDPMTSLNPVHRIGRQIAETLRLHLKLDRKTANRSAVHAPHAGRDPRSRGARTELPHPAERRDAAARHDRDRPRVRPRAAARRRADDRARRDDPGADPRPARRAAAHPPHGDDLRHARPRDRRDADRPHHGHVRGPRRRDRAARRHSSPTCGCPTPRPSSTRRPASRTRATRASRRSTAVRPTSCTSQPAARSRRAAPTRRTSAGPRPRRCSPTQARPDHLYACWHPRGVTPVAPPTREPSVV